MAVIALKWQHILFNLSKLQHDIKRVVLSHSLMMPIYITDDTLRAFKFTLTSQQKGFFEPSNYL